LTSGTFGVFVLAILLDVVEEFVVVIVVVVVLEESDGSTSSDAFIAPRLELLLCLGGGSGTKLG